MQKAQGVEDGSPERKAVFIWRNGPYIGGHLAFLFQIEF